MSSITEKFSKHRIPWAVAVSEVGAPMLQRLAGSKRNLGYWRTNGVPAHKMEEARASCHQPSPSVRPLPRAVFAFLDSLTPQEIEEMLTIGPALVRIYRAQQTGDALAREAWDFLKGNMRIFDRAVQLQPPKQRRTGGGATLNWSDRWTTP